MTDWTTPSDHIRFTALPLCGRIDDHILSCAIARIEPGGGGPDPAHVHDHDHLFTVISGEVEIRIDGEPILLVANMSFRVPGKGRHSVWNPGLSTAFVMGVNLAP